MTKNLNNQDTLQSTKVGGDLTRAYMRYNAALLTLSAHLAGELKLTLSEMAVCDHLHLDGPLTPRELGRRINLSSGAVTPLIDRLEARGFVERKPHPSDRRSILVHYLPQEPQVVGRMYAVLGRFQAAANSLSETEKMAVAGFLEAMADAVMAEVVPQKG